MEDLVDSYSKSKLAIQSKITEKREERQEGKTRETEGSDKKLSKPLVFLFANKGWQNFTCDEIDYLFNLHIDRGMLELSPVELDVNPSAELEDFFQQNAGKCGQYHSREVWKRITDSPIIPEIAQIIAEYISPHVSETLVPYVKKLALLGLQANLSDGAAETKEAVCTANEFSLRVCTANDLATLYNAIQEARHIACLDNGLGNELLYYLRICKRASRDKTRGQSNTQMDDEVTSTPQKEQEFCC